jgi:hypothetical protein
MTFVSGVPAYQELQLTKTAGKNICTENGTYIYYSNTGGDEMIDGNMGTRWVSDVKDQEIGIYFNSPDPIELSGLTIFWELAVAGAYAIQYTDAPIPWFGATWYDVYSTTSGNGGYYLGDGCYADPIRFAEPISATAIKIIFSGFYSRYGNYSIYELQANSNTEYTPLVYGLVKDTAGNPIPGALVHLGGTTPPDGWGTWTSVYTDAGGAYSFVPTTTGSMELTADAWQYKNVDTVINVTDDGVPIGQNFVLPAKVETSLAANWNFEEEDPANPGLPRYWTPMKDDLGNPIGTPSLSTDWNHTPGGQFSGKTAAPYTGGYGGWIE